MFFFVWIGQNYPWFRTDVTSAAGGNSCISHDKCWNQNVKLYQFTVQLLTFKEEFYLFLRLGFAIFNTKNVQSEL